MLNMKLFLLYSVLFLKSHLVWTSQYCLVENGTKIDQSRRQLVDIPRDIPSDTVDLNLSGNNLRAIPSWRFRHMSRLLRLDFSHNEIRTIGKDALAGLESLCYLDMRHNSINFCRLGYNPVSLFAGVPLLRVLQLAENPGSGDCISRLDGHLLLTNIRELSISIDQDVIRMLPFRKMNFLEKLSIIGGNLYYPISNYTFKPFVSSKLTTVIIEDVLKMEEGAFSEQVKLDDLIIRRSPLLGLKAALLSLRGLESHNITSIVLSDLNPSVPDDRVNIENFYINNSTIRYLANICVKHIDLSDNNIMGSKVSFNIFSYSNYLETFNFRGNNLSKGNLLTLLRGIYSEFSNVRSVDVSWSQPTYGQHHLPAHDVNNLLRRELQTSKITIFNFSCNARWNKNVDFESINLDVIDMSYTKFSVFPAHPEEQTWSKIKLINVSGSALTELDLYTAFGVFSELRILIARALIKFNLKRYDDGMPYKVFPKLKFLDIADNGISYIAPNSFKGLPLETLDISNNKLISLPQAIVSLNRLITLYISSNAITNLNIVERTWIEEMVIKSDKAFTIIADGNPFACVCTTIDFLQWFLETSVVSGTVEQSSCHFENGTQISLLNLRKEFKNFSVSCQSQFWLTVAISMGCVVAIGILVSIVSYRYRWNIKYWLLTRCRKNTHYETIVERDYPFDAFVAYNHEDYDWACFRLRAALEEGKDRYRLCLHHRDFPVGESIQQNIVDAVNSSRKVILVITRKYLACDWGEFEIQMAGMRMVQEGRENVIIAILLEEIPVRKMPRSLLSMWKHITFLLWKDDPVDERIFWARLSDAMAR